MKQIVVATALSLVAGCASVSESGSTAGEEAVPLYRQNPANCAEASFACRRQW